MKADTLRSTEEPCAGIPHAGVCGGSGRVTAAPTRPADGLDSPLFEVVFGTFSLAYRIRFVAAAEMRYVGRRDSY